MKILKTLSLFTIASAITLPTHAADIKQQMINVCISDTVKYQVADNKTAQKLCRCTVNVRGKMTFEQMWQAQSYTQNGKDPMELAFMVKMKQDLQQCTKGLTLNPPKKP